MPGIRVASTPYTPNLQSFVAYATASADSSRVINQECFHNEERDDQNSAEFAVVHFYWHCKFLQFSVFFSDLFR